MSQMARSCLNKQRNKINKNLSLCYYSVLALWSSFSFKALNRIWSPFLPHEETVSQVAGVKMWLLGSQYRGGERFVTSR